MQCASWFTTKSSTILGHSLNSLNNNNRYIFQVYSNMVELWGNLVSGHVTSTVHWSTVAAAVKKGKLAAARSNSLDLPTRSQAVQMRTAQYGVLRTFRHQCVCFCSLVLTALKAGQRTIMRMDWRSAEKEGLHRWKTRWWH